MMTVKALIFGFVVLLAVSGCALPSPDADGSGGPAEASAGSGLVLPDEPRDAEAPPDLPEGGAPAAPSGENGGGSLFG